MYENVHALPCAISSLSCSNQDIINFILQILFIAGLALVIGLERTFRFFFQKHKLKGSSCFLGGVLVVLFGWPLIGMIIEIYGFVLLFR